MGVILTMTMVMMTGLAMTRERERGTMENLLATPVQPLEVISGKIVPYIFIGLIQSTIILLASRYVFQVPFLGSVVGVYLAALLFIAANLDGRHHAVLAAPRTSYRRCSSRSSSSCPTILLSGFMFPFAGMPTWAQWIGNVLPMTLLQPDDPQHPAQGQRLAGSCGRTSGRWRCSRPSSMTIAVRFYKRTLD